MTAFLLCASTAGHPDRASVSAAFDRGVRVLGSKVQVHQLGNVKMAAEGGVVLALPSGPARWEPDGAGRNATATAELAGWLDGLEGGFAALEVDAAAGVVRIARDRFGAVPVYWLQRPGLLVASTRLLAIAAFLEEPRFDEAALLEVLRFRWSTGASSLLAGVSQLDAASVLAWSPGGGVRCEPWWRLRFRGDGPLDMPSQKSLLHAALGEAISDMLGRARQPGILLSGGVDSTVIAAICREHRDTVPCFIAAIPGTADEELGRARFVADRLGLPLTVVELDPARFAEDLDAIVALLGEPPRNPNNLVLLQLYRAMAEAGVDVALNGDGPEMLLGLADSRRVAQFEAKQRRAARLPLGPRRLAAAGLRALGGDPGWRLARILDETPLGYALALEQIGYSRPVARTLGSGPAGQAASDAFPRRSCFAEEADFDDALHRYQCETTLLSSQRRHDCLARAAGTRALAPFLHPAVLEVARQLPRALRFTDRSRPVLKALCDELVHPDVANWPKLGFPVPWEDWLEGPLRGRVADHADCKPIAPLLPAGFVGAAFAERDAEAIFTLSTLCLLRAAIAAPSILER